MNNQMVKNETEMNTAFERLKLSIVGVGSRFTDKYSSGITAGINAGQAPASLPFPV
jgi:hypothetical protein